MLCPQCGQSLPEGSSFCFGCGGALTGEGEGGAAQCARCGARLPPGLRFCTECGASLEGSAQGGEPAVVRKAKRPMPAWAFLLLGCGALIAVGLVAAIVMGVLALRYMGPEIEKAVDQETRSTLRGLRNAVQSFHADTGTYPARLADVAADKPPKEGLAAEGGRVIRVPIDPQTWEGPYLPTEAPPTEGHGPLPMNLVTRGNREGRDWSYETKDAARLGEVRMGTAARGRDKDGRPYSEW